MDSIQDVFLSFRVEDQRRGFTSHLHCALIQDGIKAFIDENLEKGEEIAPALQKAVRSSRISVIIFSKGYAESRWCLDQLVQIMELCRSDNILVLPVFYGVEPCHLRHQQASVAEALRRHRGSGRVSETTLLDWKNALTQAANISGWVTNYSLTNQGELVLDIVKCIQSKGLPTRLNICICPLRYDKCHEYLNVFMQAGAQEVVTVGICGPSGMGKTATARVMYDQLRHNFDGCCFLADVASRSCQSNYLVRLQEALISEILSQKNVMLPNTTIGSDLIRQNLCYKRVLIVLDNVDDIRQVYALVGAREVFGLGSKIIVTTRDVQLLELIGVDQFIFAHGSPLPENVAAIWEPYQRSHCIIAGLKEYAETFNLQKQAKLRHLQAVLLEERRKSAAKEMLISELRQASGEGSASKYQIEDVSVSERNKGL